MYKLVEIKPLPEYQLWARFNDGTEGIINLSHLKGKGVFLAWDKTVPFEKAFIHPESGAVAWNEDLDIDPLNLYLKINKVSIEDMTLKVVN